MIILREEYNKKISDALKMVPIVVLIGARQVGKTTIMNSLEVKGNKLYLNGEDPEIIQLFEKKSIIEQYLKVNLSEKLNGFLFIDEFQFIPKISTILKLLTDEYNKLRIICSGSSSLTIISSIEESLAGRLRLIYVYSLSFREYLKFIDESLYNKYLKYKLTDENLIIDKRIPILLNEYLLYGGLPRVTLAKNYKKKTELLNDIYQTYLLKDVRHFIKSQDFVKMNNLLKLLAAQISNNVNINELSRLSHLSYRACEEYISILEGMNILKLVSPHTTNKRKEIVKMKKVYFQDIGLRNIVYNSFNNIEIRTDNGALFENFVYNELLRKVINPDNIYYYKTKDGLEIDFIIDNYNNIYLFEAKFQNIEKAYNIQQIKTFGNIQSYSKAFVVNRNNNSMIENTRFIPAYLLDKMKLNI